MARQPITLTAYSGKNKQTSQGALKGLNKRDAKEFQSLSTANKIEDFIQNGDGVLEKIKGKTSLIETGSEVTMLEKMSDNIYIVGHGNTVSYYRKDIDTLTALKTFPNDDPFSGVKFGDYFYVTNGSTEIYVIKYKELANIYDEANVSSNTTTGGSCTFQSVVRNGNYLYFIADGVSEADFFNTYTTGDKYRFTANYSGIGSSIQSAKSYMNNTYSHTFASNGTLVDSTMDLKAIVGEDKTSNTYSVTINSPATTTDADFTPTGVIDGSNKVFTLTRRDYRNIDVYVDGSLVSGVLVNGLEMTVPTAPTSTIECRNPLRNTLVPYMYNISIHPISDTELDISSVSGSPKAKHLIIYDNRLVAGNKIKDEAFIQWSNSVDPANDVVATHPFTSWSVGSDPTPTESYAYRFDRYGALNDFGILGSQLVCFYDDGKIGIRILTEQTDAGFIQSVQKDFQYDDQGGFGAITTSKGIFYTNEAGIWQMVSGGNTNQPYSAADSNLSLILGSDEIKGIDFSNSSLILDNVRNYLLVSAVKDSKKITILYSLDNKSWFISNIYDVNVYMKDGDNLLAGGDKVYKLFDGYNNDGSDFIATIHQELPVNIDERNEMLSLLLKGFWTETNIITVSFDIYTMKRELKEDVFSFTLGVDIADAYVTDENGNLLVDENGNNIISKEDSLVVALEKSVKKIARGEPFTRLIMKITDNSSSPLKITYYQPEIRTIGINNIY